MTFRGVAGVQCRFLLWSFIFGESSQVIHNLRPKLWSKGRSSQLPPARLLGSLSVLSCAFSIGHPTGRRQQPAAWQMAGGLLKGVCRPIWWSGMVQSTPFGWGGVLDLSEVSSFRGAAFWEEMVMISMTVSGSVASKLLPSYRGLVSLYLSLSILFSF